MSRRKLAVVGYRKEAIELDDDDEFKAFITYMDEQFFHLRDEGWIQSFLSDANSDTWMESLKSYLDSCEIFHREPFERGVVVDQLLNKAIDGIYNQKSDAHSLTAASYKKIQQERRTTSTNVLDDIDYTSPEVIEMVRQLCLTLGITQHPDALVSLKACCIFIKQNLGNEVIEQRNADIESGKKEKSFALNKCPLGMAYPSDPVVTAAARILRLLSIGSLRNTQSLVNETLSAIQHFTVDKERKPAYDQAKVGVQTVPYRESGFI